MAQCDALIPGAPSHKPSLAWRKHTTSDRSNQIFAGGDQRSKYVSNPLDFYTQDKWDNCAGTVTNEYVDPQCSAYQGSTCNSWTQGVYHDVYCDIAPTIGTCNIDWANVNVHNTWDGQTTWEYMRTWVDIYGDHSFHNNVS